MSKKENIIHLSRLRTINHILFLIFLTSSIVFAQDQEEPITKQFNHILKQKYFHVSALVQVVGDYQSNRSYSGHNGFSIALSRVRLKGELDKGFSYLFQYDFTKSAAILDAKIQYKISPLFVIGAGLFKAPFSREFLTYAADIDFINRAQVVSILAPKRQIGVELSGWIIQNTLKYNAGLFNGNGYSSTANDNNDLLSVGRISFYPKWLELNDGNNQLEIAVDYAHSKDEKVSIGDLFPGSFRGDRELLGADFRLIYDRFLLSGEFITATLEPKTASKIEPSGYQVTFGYTLNKKYQLLARWDSFSPDNSTSQDSDLLILGCNFFPSSPTELQLNYNIPIDDDTQNKQLLVNFQISL